MGRVGGVKGAARRAPANRPALVRGAAGPVNSLPAGDRGTAVLDFELAHLGDPMEDLAWVGTRHAQEPLPDFDRLLRGYAAAAGREPDPERIRFHAVFAELRIAVLAATGADDADEGRADSEKSTNHLMACLLYTSPSPRDRTRSRMPSSA